MTELPIHKDILGRDLQVGDWVIVPRGPGDARCGTVIKLCKEMVKVEHGTYQDHTRPKGLTSLAYSWSLMKYGE